MLLWPLTLCLFRGVSRSTEGKGGAETIHHCLALTINRSRGGVESSTLLNSWKSKNPKLRCSKVLRLLNDTNIKKSTLSLLIPLHIQTRKSLKYYHYLPLLTLLIIPFLTSSYPNIVLHRKKRNNVFLSRITLEWNETFEYCSNYNDYRSSSTTRVRCTRTWSGGDMISQTNTPHQSKLDDKTPEIINYLVLQH